MNGAKDESRSRGLDFTVDLGWSELDIELCNDEAGDTERLRSSKAFVGRFRYGGGGVGEMESLLCVDLSRIDCDVWMVDGVGDLDIPEPRGEGELSLDLVRCAIRFEAPGGT